MARINPDTAAQLPADPLRYFTDREVYLGIFRRLIRFDKSNALRVLAIHGVGGDGKTILLKKFADILAKEFDPLPFASFSFDNLSDPTQAWHHVLLRFYADLRQQFKIELPKFELCAALYRHRIGGPSIEFARLSPTFGGLWDVLNGATAGVGGVIVGKISSWAEYHPDAKAWLHQAGGTEEITRLDKLDDESLIQEFVRLFMADLAKSDHRRPLGTCCQAVLFLDAYEALWSGRETGGSAQARLLDEWVRRLAKFALGGNILLVISGRDRLYWAQDEPDAGWDGDLEQHRIGGFSRPDAFRFLAACGLPEPPDPLAEAVLNCCRSDSPANNASSHDTENHHPLYLQLCVEICLNEQAATGLWPNPDQFHGIPSAATAKTLANRFLKSLHCRAMELWLMELSLTPRFNETVVLALDNERSHHNGPAGWERLLRFSFIEPGTDGLFRLHKTMRAVLPGELKPDKRDTVLKWFAAFWTARSTQNDAQPGLEFHHRWRLAPTKTAETWRNDFKARLKARETVQTHSLLALWEDTSLDDADRAEVGDQAWAYSHSVLGLARSDLPAAPRADILRAAMENYLAALQVWTEADFPQQWAMTQNNLGTAYGDFPTGDRADNLAKAIDCYRAALRIYTEADFPQDWAMTQNNLGIAYGDFPTGDRADNLAKAIECYRAALRIFTEADFPQQWAATQNNLGNAYLYLPIRDRTDNLAKAIECYRAALRIRTEADFPQDWAMTQNNLGIAYGDFPTGERADNLAKAIECYRAALRIFTEADFPQQWAATQNNLGNSYLYLPTGDRTDNLAKAIACYRAALRIRTEADFPQEWATIQNNLGAAYTDLPTGDRADNLTNAIACYNAALRIYTEADFPQDWACTQNNLGIAYSDLPTGDRADNLAKAIDRYHAALRIRTETDFPQDWAMTQNNLGAAYQQLPTGDRADNVAKAIDCYRAALRIWTEADFPQYWATIQNNLGEAYRNLPTGDRANNLAKAIVCYNAALRIRTETDFPQYWATTQNNLKIAEEALRNVDAPSTS